MYWDAAVQGRRVDDRRDCRCSSGSQLFFSTFYNGSLMLTLDDKKPAATVLWKGKSDSEIQTDGLHAVIATPVFMATTSTGSAATASSAA